jgi:ATP-dependent Lon protease
MTLTPALISRAVHSIGRRSLSSTAPSVLSVCISSLTQHCGSVHLSRRPFASSRGKGDDDSKKPPVPEAPESVSAKEGEVHETATIESPSSNAIQRRGGEVPQFPNVLAIPLPRRPLFPGQHAAINISHPAIAEAITKLYQSNHPYVGTFLLTRATTDQPHSGEEVSVPTSIIRPSSFEEGSESSDDEGGLLESISKPASPVVSKSGARVVRPPSENTSSASKNMASREIIEDPFRDLYQVGCLAKIEQIVQSSPHRKGSMFVVLSGVRRLKISEPKNSTDNDSSVVSVPCYVDVDHWIEGGASPKKGNDSADDIMTKALVNETISLVRQIAAVNPLFKEQIDFIRSATDKVDLTEPGRIADFATTITTASAKELQQILEEKIVSPNRLQKSLFLLRKELETSQLQAKIGKEVEEKMTKQHREYFLREQMKVIRKELGMEKDDKESLIEKFKKRMNEYSMVPPGVMTQFNDEIEKLQSLDKNSSEFNVTRSYLEWITSVPWGVMSTDSYNLTEAKTILDEDHYGLGDVKDRILELIAVGKLRGPDLGLEGKIICLQGPPGVGKTSVAKSIARALHREYYRFSVGGLYDVSEIKGHRRTYVGAMPGKIVQSLKLSKTMNPLILIDEIDKLAHGGAHGDPASALLEVLDPSQNNSFMDHYLDLPIDLSKALFVCTANQLETIPGPLKDRMEIIRLSGYDIPEKIEIAKNYLIPKTLKSCGLDGSIVSVSDTAIDHLIRGYARESGVRTLEKYIEKIMRKISLKTVQSKENAAKEILHSAGIPPSEETAFLTHHGKEIPCASIPMADVITQVVPENLQEIIGKAPYPSEKIYDATRPPPGVVMGLAWTSVGGTCLYVEAVTVPSWSSKKSTDGTETPTGGKIEITGQLGSVMNESSKIALTVAKRVLHANDLENTFFAKESIHLHFPEGATPKDGPSAGVTMATSLLSLATGTPVPDDIAMTGELSITGLVLPVGGIKEKTIAARRAGIKRLCLPEANRRDVLELPEYLKEGIEIHHFSKFDDLAKFTLGVGNK